MMAKEYKPPRERPNPQEPVRLDAWVAATQPRLHPTQRKVLQAVAELSSGDVQVPSSAVREKLGLSQQLLNRHLRTLESGGLVHLESPGAGLPLLAQTTSLGLRALGLRGPQPVAKPETDDFLAAREASAKLEQPASPVSTENVNRRSRLRLFMDQLYKALAPYLAGLNQESFNRLVSQAMAEVMDGSQRTVTAAPPAAPSPAQSPAPAQAAAAAMPPSPAPPVATPTPEGLPALNPAESALEDRLAQSAHSAQRRLPWWERTKELSNLWDQTRRHRLGVLGTYFSAFGPRWLHPEWEHFNRARRQADARGASYEDWVAAQFDRLAHQDRGDVAPEELHGDEAAQAWQCQRQPQAVGCTVAGPPPYTPASFNVHNPDHAAYAEELLEEISFLATRVYGDDPAGPIRLLAQAVEQRTLPVAALDLRPAWKDQVLAALGPGTWGQNPAQPAHEPGRGSTGGPPPVII